VVGIVVVIDNRHRYRAAATGYLTESGHFCPAVHLGGGSCWADNGGVLILPLPGFFADSLNVPFRHKQASNNNRIQSRSHFLYAASFFCHQEQA